MHLMQKRNKFNELKKAVQTGMRRANASLMPVVSRLPEPRKLSGSKDPAKVTFEVASRGPSISTFAKPTADRSQEMKKKDCARSSDEVASNPESSHPCLRILPLFL
jgi:hypothetical protein